MDRICHGVKNTGVHVPANGAFLESTVDEQA
jgi:hypothetical protein